MWAPARILSKDGARMKPKTNKKHLKFVLYRYRIRSELYRTQERIAWNLKETENCP